MFGNNYCSPRPSAWLYSVRHSRRLLIRRSEQWGPPLKAMFMFILHSANNVIDEEDNSGDDKRKKPSTMKSSTSLQEDRSSPSSSHGMLRPNRPSSLPNHPMPVCTFCLQFGSLTNSSLPSPGPELCPLEGGMIITAGSSLFSLPSQPLISTIKYKRNQRRRTHAYLPHQCSVMYSVSCLASLEKHPIALSTLLVSRFTARHTFACSHLVYWTAIINMHIPTERSLGDLLLFLDAYGPSSEFERNGH